MNSNDRQQLIDEVAKLRETGEALVERVEDVAASIRYLTNNLLDEQYHPEMATAVRDLAQRAGDLVSLSAAAQPDAAASAFAGRINGVVAACESALTEPEPEAVLPPTIEQRVSGLLTWLRDEAVNLEGCQQFGEETAWQWWENRYEEVSDAFRQLEEIGDQAESRGIDWRGELERLGGVPAALTSDQWPEELVAAANEHDESEAAYGSGEGEGGAPAENGERQKGLFDEPSAGCAAEPSPAVAESRESQGPEGMDSLDSHHRPDTNSHTEDDANELIAKLGLSLGIATKIELLVAGLQSDAEQLAACQQQGEPAVMQWWTRRLPSIEAAVDTIERLEEEALAAGGDARGWLERLGGIPEPLRKDRWPVEDRSTHKPLSEAIYDAYAFEDRVSYAKHCLLDGDTDHRDFDTCFEMFDGRLVVVRLLQLARNDSRLAEAIEQQGWSEEDQRYADDLPLSYEQLIEQARAAVDACETQSATKNGSIEQDAAEECEPKPYSYEDWQAFYDQVQAGDITAAELKRQFAAMRANRSQIVEALVKSHNAKQLKAWCLRWNRRGDGKKQDNAESLVATMLSTFSVGQSIRYSPFEGETYEDAVAKAVEAVTDDDIASLAAEHAQRNAAHEKAITNPETPQEWSLYVRSVGGYQQLDPDKKAQYERVRSDQSRAERASRATKHVSQLAIDEDLAFTVKEGFHDKKQQPLWIVQLSSRVERTTFNELKAKAKELGGWYSSFKKADAGFQFWDEAAAKLFTELLDGDVDNSEAVAARKIRRMTNAGERLHAVADTLQERCEQVLVDDETKRKNTARRASMAAGMREDAQSGLATVKTLRAIGDQLAAGENKYLDGLNAATQLFTLTQLLRGGKYERIRQETAAMRDDDRSGVRSHLRYEELSAQPLCEADVAYAQYPHPHIYREHLEQAFAKLANTPGVKQSTAKMRKLVATADPEKTTIEFRNEHAVEVLADFLQRAKGAGYDCYWFDHCLERYKRMRAANIHNVFELRTALRELLPYVAEPAGDDPVKQAEDALRGKKLDGFFPTPPRVIHQMLEYAEIDGTDRVLEPSAGKGDILDAIAAAHPDVELRGVETNRTLRDVLVAKGYEDAVTFEDFLRHEGRYSRIVMNPPFEQGADIDHVRHAYDLLEEGGRLVAIMSQGPFFRSDKKSEGFRQWLESLEDAYDEELPEDAFQGSDAFRQTGVRTRLVVIGKPA